MEFTVVSALDTETVAYEMMQQLSYEEILEFIVYLDLFISDWDFTEKLYKWAKDQHKEFKAEKKEFS